VDQLGFVEAVDRFGERVVITITDAADRRLDAGFGQAVGILDRDVLTAAVTVVDEPAAMGRAALIQSLFKSIEDETGMSRAADPPADDISGENVDDESDIDEALPGRQWSRKRLSASPPRTVRAPFSAYGSLFNLGPGPWRPHDSGR
jgi:hypothetical protein